ncbi:Phosphorelay intermediate protein [Coemansia sp. RSA 988]|nr:Phosphorelay intermediate protein [Coemansia sp. RSA 988]
MNSKQERDSGQPKDPESEEDLDNDILDIYNFNQLLAMDDDGDIHAFSRDIVSQYFDQARSTFADMEKALKEKDLLMLSSLGHYLKGSSATIGVKKVMECCKNIQFLGKLQNISGKGRLEKEQALKLITQELRTGKKEYVNAMEFLGFFYDCSFAPAKEDSKPNVNKDSEHGTPQATGTTTPLPDKAEAPSETNPVALAKPKPS